MLFSVNDFMYSIFQLELNTKQNGWIFTRYPVNTSENGNTMLKILTRAAEKTKRSWTYMRENGVDSPYLFLHSDFSMVASPGHTKC